MIADDGLAHADVSLVRGAGNTISRSRVRPFIASLGDQVLEVLRRTQAPPVPTVRRLLRSLTYETWPTHSSRDHAFQSLVRRPSFVLGCIGRDALRAGIFTL